MDVLTFETCWAVKREIIKQVTSSWSIFSHLSNDARSNKHKIYYIKLNILSLCLYLALVVQHAKRMRHTILPSAVCLDLPYVATLSHKRLDFRKEILLNTKRAFWFFIQPLSGIVLIQKDSSERWSQMNTEHRSSYKTLVILVRFFKKAFLFGTIKKISNIKFREKSSNGWRVVPCWEINGRTEVQNQLIVAFHSFASAPSTIFGRTFSQNRYSHRTVIKISTFP